MTEIRKRTVLSDHRWAQYITAGLAGSFVALGPQTEANAEFTFVEVGTFMSDRTPGNGYFDIFGPYTFGASGASFAFAQAFNEPCCKDQGVLAIYNYGNLSIAGVSGQYAYPAKLAYGQAVSAVTNFISSNRRGDMAWASGYPGSRFRAPGLGYVGFRFDVGNGTQYGFAEVIMDGVPINTATFVGYGWGDPGEPVFAGQRPVVPEPGCLALLALGSVGVLAWRRDRSGKKEFA